MAEVPLQRGLAVLAAELEGSDRRLPLCQLPQLLHVLDRVRHRDEPAAGTKHARELREREIEIADVEEHPGRQGDVELTVAERKRARVTDAGVESLGALDLDHPRRLVDPYQLNVKLAKEALRHLAFAAADLEHPPWTRLHNGIVCHVARGRALRRRVNGLPRREVRLRLVLCADERRVVGACQPRATLGSLSSPSAAISSRIFSSDRRMRRETCICEIPTCCAICDCVSPLKNRRWRIIRSRSSSTRKPGARTARSSDTSY